MGGLVPEYDLVRFHPLGENTLDEKHTLGRQKENVLLENTLLESTLSKNSLPENTLSEFTLSGYLLSEHELLERKQARKCSKDTQVAGYAWFEKVWAG